MVYHRLKKAQELTMANIKNPDHTLSVMNGFNERAGVTVILTAIANKIMTAYHFMEYTIK